MRPRAVFRRARRPGDRQELETMLLDLYDLCDDEDSLQSAKTAENGERPAAVFHGTVKIPLSPAASESLPAAVAV